MWHACRPCRDPTIVVCCSWNMVLATCTCLVAKQLLVAASMPLTYTVLAVYCFGSLLLWQPTAMFGSTALAVRQPIGIAVMVMLCV